MREPVRLVDCDIAIVAAVEEALLAARGLRFARDGARDHESDAKQRAHLCTSLGLAHHDAVYLRKVLHSCSEGGVGHTWQCPSCRCQCCATAP
jgi:hypothetical protein